MDSATLRTRPRSRAERQTAQHMAAGPAALAARVPAVDADQRAAMPQRLVLQLPHEFAPTRVGNRLRQAAILLHAAHMQRLDGDHLVLVHQSRRGLVQGIVARISDTRMQARDLELRLAAIGGARLFPGLAPPQYRESRFLSLDV